MVISMNSKILEKINEEWVMYCRLHQIDGKTYRAAAELLLQLYRELEENKK